MTSSRCVWSTWTHSVPLPVVDGCAWSDGGGAFPQVGRQHQLPARHLEDHEVHLFGVGQEEDQPVQGPASQRQPHREAATRATQCGHSRSQACASSSMWSRSQMYLHSDFQNSWQRVKYRLHIRPAIHRHQTDWIWSMLHSLQFCCILNCASIFV